MKEEIRRLIADFLAETRESRVMGDDKKQYIRKATLEDFYNWLQIK